MADPKNNIDGHYFREIVLIYNLLFPSWLIKTI